MSIIPILSLLLTSQQPLQVRDTIPLTNLDEVVVEGFLQRATLSITPAAVSILGKGDFSRFSPASAVPALNSVPGVRMEERSPGSYRLAIRGSSLRSPFGVRNIRLYYEHFPFTDAGGNTYLNLFAPAAIDQIELLRGPAASLYGAGSGGALLAGGARPGTGSPLRFSFTGGSNGLIQADASVVSGTTDNYNRIQVHHQQASGYREQSSMKRNFLSWYNKHQIRTNYQLSTIILFSDLEYQTPGALTQAQYDADPKQSRPAGGPFPSAIDAKAAIFQQSFYGGVHQRWNPLAQMELDMVLYGSYNRITNPAIRNYERRSEPNAGARAVIGYSLPLATGSLHFSAGGEWQKAYHQVSVFGNINGNADTLQTSDAVQAGNALVFAQAQWKLANNWEINGGISWNKNRVQITRESVQPNYTYSGKQQAEWAPRLSVSKKINQWQIYGLVSKGFSPPTTAEILPSTTVINTLLKAEGGWNYEAGIRGKLAKERIWLDANIFYFRLRDAIVQRRDASGADFFDNAGSTQQWGVEISARYIAQQSGGVRWQPWMSYTFHPFKYDEFSQLENDFSGKQLPGIPAHSVAAGLEMNFQRLYTLNFSYQYSDPIWLNDANTASAKAYQLIGCRLDAKLYSRITKKNKNWQLSWFAGADNLLNQTYSLGNDINAAGGRYYNAAAQRNYFTGIRVQ